MQSNAASPAISGIALVFEATIGDEETHVDWFETQLETIRLVGLEQYLSQQINT